MPEVRIADEEPDAVLRYVAGLSGETLSPPQESFLIAAIELLGDSDALRRFNDALADAEQSRLVKTAAKDHFYALAELCEKVMEFKSADDRASLPKAIMSISAALNVGAVRLRREATDPKGGLAVLEHDQDEPQVRPGRPAASAQQRPEEHCAAGSGGHRISLEGYSDALRQSLVASGSLSQQLLADRIDDHVRDS